MRVHVLIVIPLIAGVMALVWWQGTLKKDFLTPPTPERLAVVKAKAANAFSPAAPTDQIRRPGEDPQDTSEQPKETKEEQGPDLGNLDTAPGIDAYAADGAKGAPYLVKLATELEAKGSFQRALLAWERVLDVAKAEDEPYAAALAAVKRLRPTLPSWNIDPEASIPIVIHAGTSPTTAEQLKPVLEQVAREIGIASEGVLVVTVDVIVGKKMPNATASTPVALWLSGPAKDAPATDALSFTVEQPEGMRPEVFKVVYNVVSGYLASKTPNTPPAAIPSGEDPAEAIKSRITRLSWRNLGAGLNVVTSPAPTPDATPAPSGTTKPPKPNTSNTTKPPAKPSTTPSKPAASKPAAAKPSTAPKPPPKPVLVKPAPRATPAPTKPGGR